MSNNKSRRANSNRLSDLSVTVYPGYALIQGSYPVRLAQGANKFQIEGLPVNYDPNSLYFDSFTGQGDITLGAASYRAANLSPATMLQRSVNEKVTVIYGGATEAEQKEVSGTLVGFAANVALLKIRGQGVREIRNVVGYIFGNVPQGLSNTPSLAVNVEATEAGDYVATILYKAYGLGWGADYKWIYDEKAGLITIDGSVLVSNSSGATFPDAALKVVAGDAGAEADHAGLEAAPMMAAASFGAAGGGAKRSRGVRQATSESLGQVKVFTIPGRNSVEEGESQKVPFLVAAGIPVQREYRVRAQHNWHAYGRRSEAPVNTIIIFTNSEENHLGKPLPGGSVAVMQRDESGALLKSGGAYFGDTAVGEETKTQIGSDFDLKATRIVLDSKRETFVEDIPQAQVEETEAEDEGSEEVLHEGPRMTMAMPTALTAAVPEKKDTPKRLRVVDTKQCAVELFNGKPFDVDFVVEEVATGDQLRFDGDHGFTQIEAGQHERKVSLAAGQKTTVRYTLIQTSFEQVPASK